MAREANGTCSLTIYSAVAMEMLSKVRITTLDGSVGTVCRPGSPKELGTLGHLRAVLEIQACSSGSLIQGIAPCGTWSTCKFLLKLLLFFCIFNF